MSALWSQDVYRYHRDVSYALLAAERDSSVVQAKLGRIHTHLRAASVVCVLYTLLLVFFAAVAPGIDACGHKTCGADISWSAIVLGTAAGWLWTLRVAGRCHGDVRGAAASGGSAAIMEMPASSAKGGATAGEFAPVSVV